MYSAYPTGYFLSSRQRHSQEQWILTIETENIPQRSSECPFVYLFAANFQVQNHKRFGWLGHTF